jgi:plasmid maintenance system antidote protein VapI
MTIRSVLPPGFHLITREQALERLRAAIERHGSQAAYARHLGCKPTFINNALRGKINITGAIARDLGLAHVHAYQCSMNAEGTKQIDYEASRQRARELNPPIKAGEPGRVFPDRASSIQENEE